MSYNITTWKTKKIDGLEIPLATLKFSEGMAQRGWEIKIKRSPDSDHGRIIISGLGESDAEIVGWLVDSMVVVESINITGEGSGTGYTEVLLPALAQSKGKLEAVLIWECGDCIQTLLSIDGAVSQASYDL